MIAAHALNIHFLTQEHPPTYGVASGPAPLVWPKTSTLLPQQREPAHQHAFCGELATMLEPRCITDTLATRKL